ncbi:unnamed protein product [Schistosoma curassoni]|uniref:E3 ubiquitin-protein ligase MARCHF5 n=1 Tax=Schistosoma curassoni TaxID=6186 RepID=A0A183JDX7_9TREM|nr:unnamed protein product [Schistosoma curassoni]
MLEQSANVSPFTPREDKTCWICLSSEVDGNSANLWSRPCRCRGALKWVHQTCLQRWIKSNSISCQICNTPYIIVYPDCGKFCLMILLDMWLTSFLSFLNLDCSEFITKVPSIFWLKHCKRAISFNFCINVNYLVKLLHFLCHCSYQQSLQHM